MLQPRPPGEQGSPRGKRPPLPHRHPEPGPGDTAVGPAQPFPSRHQVLTGQKPRASKEEHEPLQPPTRRPHGSAPPVETPSLADGETETPRGKGSPESQLVSGGQGPGPGSLTPTPSLTGLTPSLPGAGRLPRLLPREPDADQLPSHPGRVVQSKRAVGVTPPGTFGQRSPAGHLLGPLFPTPVDPGPARAPDRGVSQGSGVRGRGPAVPGTSRQARPGGQGTAGVGALPQTTAGPPLGSLPQRAAPAGSDPCTHSRGSGCPVAKYAPRPQGAGSPRWDYGPPTSRDQMAGRRDPRPPDLAGLPHARPARRWRRSPHALRS